MWKIFGKRILKVCYSDLLLTLNPDSWNVDFNDFKGGYSKIKDNLEKLKKGLIVNFEIPENLDSKDVEYLSVREENVVIFGECYRPTC